MPESDRWRNRAACRNQDPELFFPVSDIGPGARQAERAKAVCARCPVRARCLEHALENGLHHGIYGGTTESERRTLRRGGRTVRKAA
jgi:WhiB family transcriptional regulator, redox-sensing transcriptional regulator